MYMECLRNHAASLGSYATDGCGEFTVLGDTATSPAAALQCAACGCHRNFHRKVVCVPTCEGGFNGRGGVSCMVDYSGGAGVGGGGSRPPSSMDMAEAERSGKKRFRTKITADQKEKMLAFAEKIGWKLQRKDQEDEIQRFCSGIGVSRQVFKVWMHNHKNSSSSSSSVSTGNASSLTQ
ncbi:zinc-finger homeodomain protein 4-like [Malania oleifera]|uniref:zinc-finger homeodomain protein 4-like n=1 Tax=Malania oleifera TaxID=397392 RepID=UPI0025AE41C9|nr:zinc-finger homeodomain protein 4-like [Malania oleifera]